MCRCGHDRLFHSDADKLQFNAHQCIAKRDLYQCACWEYRAADSVNCQRYSETKAQSVSLDSNRLIA